MDLKMHQLGTGFCRCIKQPMWQTTKTSRKPWVTSAFYPKRIYGRQSYKSTDLQSSFIVSSFPKKWQTAEKRQIISNGCSRTESGQINVELLAKGSWKQNIFYQGLNFPEKVLQSSTIRKYEERQEKIPNASTDRIKYRLLHCVSG